MSTIEPRKPTPRAEWIAMVLVGVLVLSVLANQDGDSTGDEIDAWIMAQQFVEDQLVSPGSADFPSRHSGDVSIEKRGEVWFVESYVDSQNRFGASLRSRFICKLRCDGSGTWHCESLIFR